MSSTFTVTNNHREQLNDSNFEARIELPHDLQRAASENTEYETVDGSISSGAGNVYETDLGRIQADLNPDPVLIRGSADPDPRVDGSSHLEYTA
jgi:hypothetical protein